MTRNLTIVDLFSGAGGLSEGFRMAGFNTLAANDFSTSAANTYKQNHPETLFIDGKIEDISANGILKLTGLSKGDLDVLVGGPPCQAFSVYNHQRGMHDERSGLFREYIRIVSGLLPKVIVMENVTGITSVSEGLAVKEIHSKLEQLGYHVEHRILKAEEFGVPQERRRIFFIGIRGGTEFRWPNPTHYSKNTMPLFKHATKESKLKPFITVSDAIGDLPELEVGEGAEVAEYIIKAQCTYQRLLRSGSKTLYNHSAPMLSNINLERLKHIPQGGSWRDIPHRLLPNGMKRAKKSDHTKRYGRLHPDGLASTILTKCDLHWGAFIHYSQERTLTVREAARLQSFPDKFMFTGSKIEQFRQVGNAVPPILAQAVASSVREHLEKILSSKKKVNQLAS